MPGNFRRERLSMSWEVKVDHYVKVSVGGDVRGVDGARETLRDRETWKHFCSGHPPSWKFPRESCRR